MQILSEERRGGEPCFFRGLPIWAVRAELHKGWLVCVLSGRLVNIRVLKYVNSINMHHILITVLHYQVIYSL